MNDFALSPCPAAGAGVHSWILAQANRCHSAGLSHNEAESLIAERMTRQPSPANEVRTAVNKAYATNLPARHNFRQACRAPKPITAIEYDPAKLAAFAGRITAPANWRHWLWERSPKRPEAMNSWSFLSHLYKPGEMVLVFDKMDAKAPLHLVSINAPMDCRAPKGLREGGRNGLGFWFLTNPVDGKWHDTGEKDKKAGEPILSCRNWQAVTSWRYAVLESDNAPAGLWLAFLVQLPVRIAAIYTSGGRSIHALIRIDAPNKEAWDNTISPLKRPLKVLGADPGCLSGVRLTRLPFCHRPTKGFQRLLYLNPNPPECPIMNLPILFPRAESLARWRQICPRWNPEQKANQ